MENLQKTTFIICLARYRKDNRFIFRYRHQVQFGGQSGDAVFDEHYASFRNVAKNKLRRILRVLFPNIWF